MSAKLFVWSSLALGSSFVCYISGFEELSRILLVFGMGLISTAVWTDRKLNSLFFTSIIFFIATLAMCYPQAFTGFGAYEYNNLIVPILMVIMFGMGTTMSLRDFYNVLRMPRGIVIGMFCQFSIMPLVGFALASISGLPAEISAGIILVGCSPSGLASNVMSFIAKANVPLSITLTMLATLAAPLITPFLMKLLANHYVPIDFLSMFLSIVKIVILPVFAGFFVNALFRKQRELLDRILPIISMTGIVVVIAIITAAGRDSLLEIGIKLIAIVIVHNLTGYLLGYHIAQLLGMDRQSARTISLEVGMQNAGLASGIAVEMGKIASMGLAPAVFGPFMNITGSALASLWGKEKASADKRQG